MQATNLLKDWFFRQVHTQHLVYNTCWEDPRCDRVLLQLGEESEVVMISSAGCNALDYLLDRPAAIHCIDMNPRQNALLELKLSAIRNLRFGEFFRLFGQGVHPNIGDLYTKRLRPDLPNFAAQYWDKKLFTFNGRGTRQSFFHYGTSGTLAWMTANWLKLRPSLYQKVYELLNVPSLEVQRELYEQVEAELLRGPARWLANRHLIMSLAGVPRSQQQLFMPQYEDGALGYIKASLRHVFTEIPVHDNYFWRLYFEGSYLPDCCPEHLRPESFEHLTPYQQRIGTYTSTISDFLKAHPKAYSHYVLLDHQDWLAANNREALEEEWRLILQNSQPGTRILLRSAAREIDFFPDFVHQRVQFEQEETARQHQLDRVGTYASVYLGIVQA
jgi:S-adenosylmethionine-diacylglycerol 3-amino-3-carboxypropyl transferase